MSPSPLVDSPEFFAFHKDKSVWLHVIRDETDPEPDVLPRRPNDTSVILTPFGLPSVVGGKVPGVLISFYLRAFLGGARLSRIGVNFSTFLSRVTLQMPTSANQETLRECSQVPIVLCLSEEHQVLCLLAADIYREDTMWCLE